MQHYDLRVIEDCLVFSYEVVCPGYPKSVEAASGETPAPSRDIPVKDAPRKRTSRRLRKRAILWDRTKKALLRFLFLLLFPFVMAVDLAFRGLVLLIGACRRRPTYITTFVTISFFTIVSALVGLL